MNLHLHSITVDAADPPAIADFWSKFTRTANNRAHVDFGTPDLEAEVTRALDLGARLVGRYAEFGTKWATLRDPEGNEFCIGLHDPPTH